MPSVPLIRTIRGEVVVPQADSFSDETGTKNVRMDEDAFRQFYEKTSRSLFGYLWRVSGERDLAEDLLQEAYCRWIAADPAGMSEAETKSYLFRIATNLMHDHWRRQRRSGIASLLVGSDPRADSQHTGINEYPAPERSQETQTDLRFAFEQLKARERQLLWLAYVEGSSHQEIADSTGLRTGSIRLLLFRARRKLAEVLRNGERNARGKVNL